MSIWDDIGEAASSAGDAVADTAEAVAGVVGDVVNAVGEAAGDAVEAAGHAVGKAVKKLGKKVARKLPAVGRALGRGLEWVGDVAASAGSLVAVAVKGVLGAAAGIASGAIRIVGGGTGGLLAWDGKVFAKGIGDVASGIGGGIVSIGGAAIGLVQTIVPLQGVRKPLTDPQLEILRRVYRNSVALDNVRIVRGFAGLFSLGSKPFTLGNTIYFKKIDPNDKPEVLVHECGHVWQYQNLGTRYTTDALGAKFALDRAYSWEAELARGKRRWQDFNLEAQAEFLEEVFEQGSRTDPPASGGGVFYEDEPLGPNVEFLVNGASHTALARDSVTHVRRTVALHLPRVPAIPTPPGT